MIDKSTKQHYEMQGKVKNYLGKQKMVKAPLYWRSGAKHPKTELAYITKKEKDLLIKKDLHKSLKGGVNRGPSGIISLNGWGDKGDFGGSSGGGGGGNGSTNRERGIQQSYSAPAPTRSPQASQAREEKAKADKARDEERANVREQAMTKITKPPVTPRVPDFVKDIIEPPVTPKDEIDVGFQEELRKQKIARDLKIKQQDPNYGQFFRPTPIIEKPQGIMSNLIGTGKNVAGNMARQFALSKLGLGFLNPFLGIASLFGFDPIGSLMAKMSKGTGTKTAWTGPSEADLRTGEGPTQGQTPTNIVQAGIEKFKPTDQQTAQMDEMRRKMMILQGYADKGSLNERGQNTLAQMNQLISQYQVNPRSIYG